MNLTKLSLITAILSSLLIISCSSSRISSSGQFNDKLISIVILQANLEFLSHDLLEGREATTRGEKLAGLFSSSELKKYGVLPYYEDYYQRFNLNSTSFDTESFVKYDNGKSELVLKLNEDFFVVRSGPVDSTFNAVFAGYGITAEEFNYDDFSGVDVNDKFIMILNGEPYSNDTNYFNGEEDTRYSFMFSKIRNATSKGAKGIIFLDVDETGEYWANGYQWFTKPNLSLLPAEEKIGSIPVLYASISASKNLLKDEVHNYESIIQAIKTTSKIPTFSLNGTIDISIKKVIGQKESINIIAVIPGNDDNLKDEYVAIGAHFDHLGVSGDKIFNGADDDGSGVVAVLEVANNLARTKENRRSILIVFHAAEEKGLFGSEYLSDNLDIMDNIVAQINLDMVGRESIDTIYSVGSAKINPMLKQIVEEANSESANFVFNYKFDEPDDPEKIYSKSDHYNYARFGIPVVFFYDNMKEDYHKHTDTIEKINFNKIKKTAELVYLTALKIANLDLNLRTNK